MIHHKCPNCGNKDFLISNKVNYVEAKDIFIRVAVCTKCDTNWAQVFEMTKCVDVTIPSSDYEMIDHELVNQGKENEKTDTV